MRQAGAHRPEPFISLPILTTLLISNAARRSCDWQPANQIGRCRQTQRSRDRPLPIRELGLEASQKPRRLAQYPLPLFYFEAGKPLNLAFSYEVQKNSTRTLRVLGVILKIPMHIPPLEIPIFETLIWETVKRTMSGMLVNVNIQVLHEY